MLSLMTVLMTAVEKRKRNSDKLTAYGRVLLHSTVYGDRYVTDE